MIVDVGPFSRLLRALSILGLLTLGGVLVGALLGCYFFVPVRVLKPLAPLLGLAGGVGVAALLFAIARLFLLGGRLVRVSGVALAALLVVGGASVWYAMKVVQPHARGACYGAAHPASYEDPAVERARGREMIDGALFRLAQRLAPDPTIIEDCYHDEPDEVRVAHGLCARVMKGDERCDCGFYRFPTYRPCPHPRCVIDRDGARLECER